MIAAFLLFPQRAYGLPPDLLLDHPLAVEARIEPLPELLARMAKSLGTTLTVERRMEGLKATIFTPARPTRLTLAGLASVFEAEWTPLKSGGYRLSETVPARNRREAYLKLEATIFREILEKKLIEPFQLRRRGPTGDSARDAEVERMELERVQQHTPYHERLRAIYRRLPTRERDRLWDGEMLHFVSWSEGRPDERAPVGGEGTLVREYPPGPAILLLRYEPGVGVRVVSAQPSGISHWSIGQPPLQNDEVLNASTYRKEVEAWATDPGSSTAPELERPLEPGEPRRSNWARGMFSPTDVLEDLFRRSGVPVIAEATRRQSGSRAVARGRTLREALIAKLGVGGWNRVEGGVFLYRPRHFWSMGISEPPESALRLYESTPERTFEGTADMYARLPWSSIRDLRLHVLRHDVNAASEGVFTFRLWGRLSTRIQNALLHGEAVSLSQVPPEVHPAVREAISDAVFSAQGTLLPEGAPSTQVILRLLGLAEGRPLSLYAQANSGKSPRFPPDGSFDSAARPLEIRAIAIWIVDSEGNGLRLFGKIF